MSRMKAAAAPSGNRKDPAPPTNSTQQLRSAQTQYTGPDQQNPQPLLANYTLPGVISYLTLEFTNLERFKIMTNLEKSEMKYHIQQLTAEINSLRFLNDKQALRITELEERLAESKKTAAEHKEGANMPTSNSLSGGDSGQDAVMASTNTPTKSGSKIADYDIPPVDLEILRASRQKLNRSIKDVFRLLKPPSMLARNVLDIPGSEHGTHNYDELLEISPPEDELKSNHIESMFAKYALNSEDLLVDLLASFDDDSRRVMESIEEDNDNEGGANNVDRIGTVDESDAETVIVDESDEGRLLTIDESELVNSNPEPPIKLGSVVHVPVPSHTAAVYKPFQHSFVMIQENTLKVWHRNTLILTGEIKEAYGDVVLAFYLEKKRVVLVTKAGEVVLIEQKPDSDTLRRVPLHKEQSLVINAASIVEFARTGSNRLLGLAYTGSDLEGNSVIVALEVKVAQKVSSKTLAELDSNALNVSSKITALHWNMVAKQHTTGLPKSMLPKKHRKLISADDSSLLEFNLMFGHDRLLTVNLALKAVKDFYNEQFEWVDFAEGYALLAKHNNVNLFDLAAAKAISSQPLKGGSQYSLLYKDSPYVVEVDDEVRIFDSTSREVATESNAEGGMVYCDGDFLVIHSKDEVKITAIEGTNL